jgi:glutamate-1-semialdehyde 2,1-aminomutase
MSAVRAARGFTGRDKVVKFEGCYHGHSDGLLSKAGSGLATFGLPDSAGVPANLTRDTITLPYNDVEAFRTAIGASATEVAAVLVEPVAGNMGAIPPQPGFLEALRAITEHHGIVLIFDEVMTGFRLALGGAQELYGIRPDLSTFGKILGGGLPLAAYGGRADIMDRVAPAGPVYQAGTLSGNPLAVAAGLAQLDRLIAEQATLYPSLEAAGKRLAEAARTLAREAGVPVRVNQLGSMFTIFFADQPVTDYASAKRSDTARFGRFFRALLEEGVYLPPSQFEAAFVSTAHTDEILAQTEAAMAAAFRA